MDRLAARAQISEGTSDMNNLAPVSTTDADEAQSLARELFDAYARMVRLYRDQLGLSAHEADARARGLDMTPEEAMHDFTRIRDTPLEHVTWPELARLAEQDPEAVMEIWEDLKGTACDELVSGHRAAQALDWQRHPYARARFLAIRESFLGDTPPQSGIEAALIDLAAEAFGDYLELSEQLHLMQSAEAEVIHDDLKCDGRWRPSHDTVNAAIERVERRAERAHKRLLQTVKSLHELQRSAPTLYVAHAGQVNVGQQQVNVTADDPASQLSGRDLPK